jgi:hypothetical protein
MVAPTHALVGTDGRDHFHRRGHELARWVEPMASEAIGSFASRASRIGLLPTTRSIVHASVVAGGTYDPVTAMNRLPQGWVAGALWAMLAIAAIWTVYLFGSNYGNCRVDGTGKIMCFLITLFMSCLEVLIFVIVTIAKLLRLILP